jgi:phenylalanyl-tRNA synthetase beta chain
MPTIGVKKRLLDSALGASYTSKELEDILFDYGLELDDIEEVGIPNEGDYVYKIEIPANRYDLLCVEGLGRALRVFKGL